MVCTYKLFLIDIFLKKSIVTRITKTEFKKFEAIQDKYLNGNWFTKVYSVSTEVRNVYDKKKFIKSLVNEDKKLLFITLVRIVQVSNRKISKKKD